MRKLGKQIYVNKLSRETRIDRRYRSINEGMDPWPALDERTWETMGSSTLQDYLDSNDVNVVDRDGDTPLMFASRWNSNMGVIKLLLDEGADVHARNNDGWTPLMFATVFNSNPKVLQYLIDNGADVNDMDSNYRTALMLALRNKIGNRKMAHILVDNGAER